MNEQRQQPLECTQDRKGLPPLLLLPVVVVVVVLE